MPSSGHDRTVSEDTHNTGTRSLMGESPPPSQSPAPLSAATWTATAAPVPIKGRADCAPIHFLDLPPEGARLYPPVEASGWAIDANSTYGTGIRQVRLVVFLPSGRAREWEVRYGLERADIARDWGEKFRYSGYQAFIHRGDAAEYGYYTISAEVETECGWQKYLMRNFTILPPSTAPTPTPPAPLLHRVDQPVEQGYYAAPFSFAGWTAWENGGRVAKVEFYLDQPRGQGARYGEAPCNEARPDLPAPYRRCGWHFRFDPAWVSAGWHRLYVYAVDNAGQVLAVVERNFLTERGR